MAVTVSSFKPNSETRPLPVGRLGRFNKGNEPRLNQRHVPQGNSSRGKVAANKELTKQQVANETEYRVSIVFTGSIEDNEHPVT